MNSAFQSTTIDMKRCDAYVPLIVACLQIEMCECQPDFDGSIITSVQWLTSVRKWSKSHIPIEY